MDTIAPKHTAAPWRVVDDETVTVRCANDGSVATMGWLLNRGTGPRRSSAEVHANARLIAAAPDMLAALKDLSAILCDPEGNPVFDGSDGDREIARRAFAAIARAEGR